MAAAQSTRLKRKQPPPITITSNTTAAEPNKRLKQQPKPQPEKKQSHIVSYALGDYEYVDGVPHVRSTTGQLYSVANVTPVTCDGTYGTTVMQTTPIDGLDPDEGPPPHKAEQFNVVALGNEGPEHTTLSVVTAGMQYSRMLFFSLTDAQLEGTEPMPRPLFPDAPSDNDDKFEYTQKWSVPKDPWQASRYFECVGLGNDFNPNVPWQSLPPSAPPSPLPPLTPENHF